MTRPIFRKEALDRLASPEQLDQMLQLTSPRGWIALIALGLLLLLALAWGFFGTITTTVEGQGILRRQGGPVRLEAPAAGKVRFSKKIELGESVSKDQELLQLIPDDPSKGPVLSIRSPAAARILGGFVKGESQVKQGAPLLLLDLQDKPMQVLLYVSVGEGYQVQRGMSVLVSPAPAQKSKFGYLRGRVLRAAKFPTTREDMNRLLDNAETAQQLAAAGPSLTVFVELFPDPDTPDRYQWTTAKGWPLELYSGIPCQALITIAKQRPVELVMPALGDLLGF